MRNKLPKGKGWYIWGLRLTQDGTPAGVAREAKRQNFGHVAFHIHDGYLNEKSVYYGADLTPYIEAMEAEGIECWGWGAVYRTTWLAGATRVIEAFRRHPTLRGYLLDAEGPILGAFTEAKNIMVTLRNALPDIAIGLASYRYWKLHRDLPWKEFREHCDFDAPQVYWEQATNAAQQLQASYNEFQEFDRKLPYVPAGSAYKVGTWAATPAQVVEFMNKAKELKMHGSTFWVWYQSQRDLPATYEAIAKYQWDILEPTNLTLEQKVDILWKRYLGGV